MTYQHEYDPMASEMVDVGTPGIDRGEDDYVPGDEYTPGVDDDEQDDAWPVWVTLWSEDVSTWGEDTIVLSFEAEAEAEAWIDRRYAPQPVDPTPTRAHLFTFLVEIPENGDWDADEVRRLIGDGTADMYNDEAIDLDD